MTVSSISASAAHIQSAPKTVQNHPAVSQAGGDHDGDADDHGGAPDSDGVRGVNFNRLA